MGLRFCILGAGNLATHLAGALHKSAGQVLQIYSRTKKSAKELAARLDNVSYTTDLEEITTEADIYCVALSDSALHKVLSNIHLKNKLLVHCSGSLPLSCLDDYSSNTGVIYPLQTFSKNRAVDFWQVPVFIEANSEKNLQVLQRIANDISGNVSYIDSKKRKSLHVAAVFACNFVNHLYTLAADYLESKELSFQVLHPLIEETAKKALEMPPVNAQTGPAVRFDQNIIENHLFMLNEFPYLKELYNSISKSIFERHQNK